MALIDSATLKIDSGNYLLAPVGTAAPVDPATPGAPWVNIGHTSIEDILGFESEGGEQTVLGTLQNSSLRTSQAARTESWAVILQQFDAASLKLYFGSNATESVDGKWVHVPDKAVPTAAAFLAVFVDGENIFPIHAHRAEILRGDDLDLSDTESLAGLPLRVTPTKYGANPGPYSVGVVGDIIPAWAATTAYTVGASVRVGATVLECTVAGTSGASAPTPPGSVGGTVVDGSVTWERIS